MRKGDRLIFRKPKNRIEQILKNEMLKRRFNSEVKKESAVNNVMERLRKFVPVEVIIGVVACFFMYFIFGGEKLVETLLSWVIGMTIIAAIVTSLLSRYHKKK